MYIGYDYGTTFSIVTQYDDNDREQPIKILKSMPSAIEDENGLVPSPKRCFSHLPQEQDKAVRYYREFSQDMLEQALMSFPKEKARITITVPNAYKDHQCRLMLNTIREVGNKIFPNEKFSDDDIGIIPEPIAAALFYVHYLLTKQATDQKPTQEEKGLACVCDIGGGTTDLAIVRYIIERKNEKTSVTFTVVCTVPGDDQLGGDDIDAIIAAHIRNRYQLDESLYSNESLKEACRTLKHTLSVKEKASVKLTSDGEYPAIGESGEEIGLELTRSRLNDLLCKNKFLSRFSHQLDSLKQALFDSVKQGLKKKHSKKDPQKETVQLLESSIILPIGGTSQIPILQQTMQETLKGCLFLLPGEQMNQQGAAPYDSVAKGAAIYSASLEGHLKGIDSIVIEGRTLHRISIEVNKEMLETIVERNMPVGDYHPKTILHPHKADPDGTTFHIGQIRLYEGEGCSVEDTDYGKKPQLIISQKDILENLDDPIYLHGRKPQETPIEITMNINEEGRLASMTIQIPEGREDRSDYEKTIPFIQ